MEKEATPSLETLEAFAKALSCKIREKIAEFCSDGWFKSDLGKIPWVLALDVSGTMTRHGGDGVLCVAPAGMRSVDTRENQLGASSLFYISAKPSQDDALANMSFFIKVPCEACKIARFAKKRAETTKDAILDTLSLDEASARGFVDRRAVLSYLWKRMESGAMVYGLGDLFTTSPEALVLEHSLKHG